jgi:hypothetical protein
VCVSLCFGYDLALKRVFPCTLGTFSINECLLVLWVRLVLRESVSTSALGAIRMMRQRECFLVLWVRLALKRESAYLLVL